MAVLQKVFDVAAEHSEKITSVSYLVATTILLGKNLNDQAFFDKISSDWSMQMDIAACLPFYLSSICYGLAKENPRLFIRLAGANVLVASCLLAAGGYRGALNDPSFWLHAASMAPTAFAGLAFMVEKRTWGAAPELVSRPFHAIAGVLQEDIGQIAFSAFCAASEVSLIITDHKLKNQNDPDDPVITRDPD